MDWYAHYTGDIRVKWKNKESKLKEEVVIDIILI